MRGRDESSSLRCHCALQAYVSRRRRGREGRGGKEGAEDNEHRKEKEGGEKKVSGTVRERERGRQRKTGRAVIIKSLTHSYCSGYSTELRGM